MLDSVEALIITGVGTNVIKSPSVYSSHTLRSLLLRLKTVSRTVQVCGGHIVCVTFSQSEHRIVTTDQSEIRKVQKISSEDMNY